MGKQVYYAVVPKNGRVAYGYQNINADLIPASRRHLWSSYPFLIRKGGHYYYKHRGVGYIQIQADDTILISKKMDECLNAPEQWELYGLIPIYEKGVCLEHCTVLRRLWYFFFEPDKTDYMAYIHPREPDSGP